MDRKKLIELTNKVYKQTLLFPKKEPLRYRIREIADDILSKVIEWEVLHNPNRGNLSNSSKEKDLVFELEKDLLLINGYFNVVKWQNWISYFDVIKIEAEYEGLRGGFRITEVKEPIIEKEVKIVKKKETVAKAQSLDERKLKILDILKKKEKVQVWEVKEILMDVSKRTLRRDFDNLLKQGLVERIGESNNTFYKII